MGYLFRNFYYFFYRWYLARVIDVFNRRSRFGYIRLSGEELPRTVNPSINYYYIFFCVPELSFEARSFYGRKKTRDKEITIVTSVIESDESNEEDLDDDVADPEFILEESQGTQEEGQGKISVFM